MSDWTTPGLITGKPAMQCTKAEIFTEVWGQLQAHLNPSWGALFSTKSNLVRWFLDTDVRFPELAATPTGPDDINLEPLLINTVGFLGVASRTWPRPSTIFSWPATMTCALTPTWPPWKAPTRPPAGPPTVSSTACRLDSAALPALAVARTADVRSGPAPRPMALRKRSGPRTAERLSMLWPPGRRGPGLATFKMRNR